MKRTLWLALVFAGAGPVEAQVGRYSSVAIGTDGLGLVSYLDETVHKLKVAHCSNVACTSATVATLDDASAGPTLVAIGADGLGLIGYRGSSGVKVAHCANVECSSATTSTIRDGIGVVGSLVVGADGRGLLAITLASDPRFAGTGLLAAHCDNPECTAATSTTIVSGVLVSLAKMAIGPDGLPLIAYTTINPTVPPLPPAPPLLFAAHCVNPACASFSPTQVLMGTPLALTMGSDGLGLLVSSSGGTSPPGLTISHCADTACSSVTTTFLENFAARSAAVAQGSDGLGLLAYVFGGARLTAAHCTDLACAGFNKTALDTYSAASGEDNGLAIGADGLGLISFHDPGRTSLKVFHCQDVACTSATGTVLDGPAVAADLLISLIHSPQPVAGLQDLTYRIGSYNGGPDPAPSVTVTQLLWPTTAFKSAVGTGWSCDHVAGLVTCTRPEAALGALPEITVVVTAPPIAEMIYSTATISSPVFDRELSANTRTDLATSTAAPLAVLSITKSDGGGIARWSQPVTWTITAANVGSTPVAGATVTDAFPAAVTGVAWTCVPSAGSTCPASGTGALSVSVDLAVGGTVTFTASGTLSPFTYGLTNVATITPPAGHYDPNLSDNTAIVVSRVEPVQAYTLLPCRVVDTRSDQAPALGANTRRDFTVTGSCGIPADARALAVNVTAVNPGDRGNLRLFPAGTSSPLASSVNFMPGRTRAGNGIVPLGLAGQISVQCDMPAGSTATTHFVLDVYGYFK
jgi:uncharacterized repeat protein (TIGR01451 family)